MTISKDQLDKEKRLALVCRLSDEITKKTMDKLIISPCPPFFSSHS